MMTAFPELSPTPVDSLAELQAGREFAAQKQVDKELRAMFDSRHIINHKFAIGHAESGGHSHSEMTIGPNSLLAAESLGIDPTLFVKQIHQAQEGEEIARLDAGEGDHLIVSRYGKGVDYKLMPELWHDNEGSGEQSAFVHTKNRERLLQSPAHAAWLAASHKLTAQAETPKSVTTEPFYGDDDPLGTLIFLQDIGMMWNSYPAAQLFQEEMDPYDVLQTLLDRPDPSSYATQHRTDGSKTYTWGTTLRKELSIDADGQYTFSARSQQPLAYLEKANSSEVLSVPFVDTQAARDISARLDAAGLMFNPKLQLEMMQTDHSSQRFGSIYTQITREIAKWVDNPHRVRLSNLFVPYDAASSGQRLQDGGDFWNSSPEDEAAVVAAFTQMQSEGTTLSEPAAVVFSMINDVLRRGNQPVDSALPVTRGDVEVSITKGACFDVAAYYVGATELRKSDWLRQVRVGDVPMLEKKHGAHTFLTLGPTLFNGVQLPQGALMSQDRDGKFFFQRLTPFSFDEAEDQLVFGSEMSKMLQNEAHEMARIGKLTLMRLATLASR